MKKYAVLFTVLVFSCSLSIAQNSGEVLKITLDDALRTALSDNLTVQIANQEITKQEYAKKGAYSSLFPQVDLTGSYQRTIEKQVMYMDVPGMSGGMKVGTDNTWSGGVTASMPLISAPLWKSLKISAYEVELAVEKARSSRIEMTDQVKRAFYGVLLAGDAYNVFKEAYDNAVQNYNDIKQKFDKGLVAEYDVIRANVNVKNAEPNMYDAENSLILAHWQLKVLMGVDLELNIECDGELADFENSLTEYYDLYASLDNNSDLNQLDIQYKQLEQTAKMQKANFLPSLNAQFSYQWMSMNNDFKIGHYRWDPYSTLGLSLKIPVFSGGKKRSDIKQTEISLKQLSKQRTEIERNLKLAIKQSTDQMNTCFKQYNAAKAGVSESEKGYAITMKRYETGEGTLLDVNDSQLSLTQARLNLNQSIYNYLIAKSTLEKTLGNTNENNNK